MANGLKIIEEVHNSSIKKSWGFGIAISEYVLGNLYFQIRHGDRPKNLSAMAKNFKFLIRNFPCASKKAVEYLKKAIESAKRFGAKGILGRAYLDLGCLYRIKKRDNQAKECMSEAVNVFESIEAEVNLKKARAALEDLV